MSPFPLYFFYYFRWHFFTYDNTPFVPKSYVHYFGTVFFSVADFFSTKRADPDAMPQPETKDCYGMLYYFRKYINPNFFYLLIAKKIGPFLLHLSWVYTLCHSLSHLLDVRYKLFNLLSQVSSADNFIKKFVTRPGLIGLQTVDTQFLFV